MGGHFLLQVIFPTQGSNPSLLHWQADSLPLSHEGNPGYVHLYLCYLHTHRERERAEEEGRCIYFTELAPVTVGTGKSEIVPVSAFVST